MLLKDIRRSIDMPEYSSWRNMLRRCENPKHQSYKDYGGRGISVCDRWHSFAAFFTDLGRKPSVDHTIERLEVNGNYEPGNCVWLPRPQQSANRRNAVWVTHGGVRMHAGEYARTIGVSRRTAGRLIKGTAGPRAWRRLRAAGLDI